MVDTSQKQISFPKPSGTLGRKKSCFFKSYRNKASKTHAVQYLATTQRHPSPENYIWIFIRTAVKGTISFPFYFHIGNPSQVLLSQEGASSRCAACPPSHTLLLLTSIVEPTMLCCQHVSWHIPHQRKSPPRQGNVSLLFHNFIEGEPTSLKVTQTWLQDPALSVTSCMVSRTSLITWSPVLSMVQYRGYCWVCRAGVRIK